MKLYIHHLYMVLAVAALIICLCTSSLITFVYQDMSSVSMSNFVLRMVRMGQIEPTVSAASCALGVLLIVSLMMILFIMFVSLFQNFSLQKRSSVFTVCVLAGYNIVMSVFVLVLHGDTRMVNFSWHMCLPLIALILMVMSFYSIRVTEAKMLARANNFRLRD